MIIQEEKKLLKLINTYNKSVTNYIYPNIYISLNETILLVINIDSDDTVDLFDELELETSLDEIYKGKLSNHINIHNISFQLTTHDDNYFYIINILRIYYKYFSSIPTVVIGSNDSGYCSYYDLLYQIFLTNKNIYSELNFFKDILTLDYKYQRCIFVEKYYSAISWYGWQDFSRKFDLTLNSLSTLTLQTKVRRLAYLKMILNLFNESNYCPDSILNRKIELEAKKYNQDLLKHINTKGIIEITKTGNSSKPYIEAMLSLKLLYAQNNKYQLSKYGKAFNVLNTKLNIFTKNYFVLSKYEQAFFLFFILENDNLYLWALIDIIYIQNNKTTIKNIKEVFQNYIIDQLQFTIKYSSISNTDKAKITSQIKRIKSWKKPQIYLEHIIEPRINWLLDLDIIDKDEFLQSNITLSQEGLTFFSGLNSSFDIFQEKYTLVNQFVCMDYFSLINEMYSIEAVNLDELNINLIEKYIDESFNLFKTMAPNRVTASQAIIYTCFMVLFKEQKIVNFCTIKNYLSSKKNTKYIFDWYRTENDGSIRRRSNT